MDVLVNTIPRFTKVIHLKQVRKFYKSKNFMISPLFTLFMNSQRTPIMPALKKSIELTVIHQLPFKQLIAY
jgi:hypothetical protein